MGQKIDPSKITDKQWAESASANPDDFEDGAADDPSQEHFAKAKDQSSIQQQSDK